MADPAPGTPSSSSRTPAGRGSAPASLDDALQRIAQLEEKLARLEEVLSIHADGSVQIAAEGQLRLMSTNNLLLEAGANWIELGITGVDVTAAANLKLETSTLRIQAAVMQNNAAMNEGHGVLRCDTLIANSVVASSYTPGAGNVW